MNKKIDYNKLGAKGLGLMNEFDTYLNQYEIDPLLRELIKIRVSQINGCAFCLSIHSKAAIKLGENPERLYTLSAWQDSNLFSEAEKAVLNLVEHVTRVSSDKVPTSVYDGVMMHYSDEDYVMFVFMINHMNSWNRLSISMGNKAS